MTRQTRSENLALAEFHDALCKAKQIADIDPDGANKSAQAAISACLRYVDTMFPNTDFGLPLARLHAALKQLNHGITAPMLVARNVLGRHEDSAGRALIKTYAAATTQILMDFDFTARKAAGHVAVVLNQNNILIGGRGGVRARKITSTTILNWRSQIKALNSPNQYQDHYRSLVSAYPRSAHDETQTDRGKQSTLLLKKLKNIITEVDGL